MARLFIGLCAVLLALSAGCDGPGKKEMKEVSTQDGRQEPDGLVADAASDVLLPPEDLPAVEVEDLAGPEAETVAPAETLDQATPPDVQPGCPAELPTAPPAPCQGELHCEYGEECCCGDCSPSLVCDCQAGSFACYYTDACLGPWCQLSPCCQAGQEDACEGGAGGQCKVEPGEAVGKCLPAVPAPQCWLDSDCAAGEECLGASICPCNADCDGIDTPGQCQPAQLPPGCCWTAEDCDLGGDMAFSCGFLTPASDLGVCLPLALGAECWDDSDCVAGTTCVGATFCDCGKECGQIEAPGDCLPTPTPEVCKADSQCPPDSRCVGVPACQGGPGECPGGYGKCLPLPDPGLCWGDVDCSFGQVCVNAVFCEGGKVCLVEEHEGVCLDAAANGCWADGDCVPPVNGLVFRCTGQWVIPWWTGNDYDAEPDFQGECCALTPGSCYEDEDCLAGQACQGAIYPYLGACTDDADDEKPGQCVDQNPWPEELCLTDAECTPGQSCIGEWSCPQEALCLDPQYPGLCLDDPYGGLEWCYEVQHCSPGKACGGASVCDVIGGEMCGGLMAAPGLCQPISYPPADLGEPCGPDGGQCKPELACCYPCGIPGCLFTCSTPCDGSEPWCADGCPMVP
jgi:hypothetical protein